MLSGVYRGLDWKDHGIPIRSPHSHHGNPSQPRFGEKLRKGKAVTHMAEKRVVKAVIEMRNDGLSLRQIAAYLDKIGVPTKKQGKKWHPEMVKRIITSHGGQDSCKKASCAVIKDTFVGEFNVQ